MLNEQDKADIIEALNFFRTNGCNADWRNLRFHDLIRRLAIEPSLDDRPFATNGWKVGTKLRNKRHGWEGEIVAPLGRKGLINVDVGIGIKVGEHSSDWDFVCGPEGETEEG